MLRSGPKGRVSKHANRSCNVPSRNPIPPPAWGDAVPKQNDLRRVVEDQAEGQALAGEDPADAVAHAHPVIAPLALDRAQRQHERLDDHLKKTRELFEAKFESADTLKEHELAFRQAEADLASLAETLREAKETPIDILAYWHADQDRISQAKLRSLKRGMAIRSVLRDYGVSSTRIVLRQVALEADSPQLVDIVKIAP